MLFRSIDIFLPDFNVGIEFNGLYFHSEISGNRNKNYHLNKTQKATEKNIHLIHIFEDEWKNKQDIVKDRLKNVLHKNNENKIYARKCEIVEINDNRFKNEFLKKNHIQGSDKSKICIGLKYGDNIVCVSTFSNPRKALGKIGRAHV